MILKSSDLNHHSITKYSMTLEEERRGSCVDSTPHTPLTPQKLNQIPHTTRNLGQSRIFLQNSGFQLVGYKDAL
jgi:hypothetical protein